MPTISSLIVANMALSHIGAESTISSLSEDSAEANECSLWMEYSRLETLEALDWNFARKPAPLALHPQPFPELSRYSYRYIYPSDCVKMRLLVNPLFPGKVTPWDARVRLLGSGTNAIPFEIEHADLNVVSNGTFDAAATSVWTANSGWTIGAGVATGATASTDLEQTIATELTEGSSYVLTFTTTVTSGSVTPKVGGTSGTARSSSGTYTETIVAGTTDLLEFTGSSFIGTIDNVSLATSTSGRAILTDLQDAIAIYTFDQSDLSVWSPMGVKALSFSLASNIAYALTKKTSIRDRMKRDFFYYLGSGGASNANEGVEQAEPDAPWIAGR